MPEAGDSGYRKEVTHPPDKARRVHTHPAPAALELLHEGIDAKISFLVQKLTARCTVISIGCVRMILPQVHLRKPCYDFSFL